MLMLVAVALVKGGRGSWRMERAVAFLFEG
jgi:hypothetical protein